MQRGSETSLRKQQFPLFVEMLSKTPAESFLTLQVVLNGIVSLHKHTSNCVFVVCVRVHVLSPGMPSRGSDVSSHSPSHTALACWGPN